MLKGWKVKIEVHIGVGRMERLKMVGHIGANGQGKDKIVVHIAWGG